jgi:hypothetical protein
VGKTKGDDGFLFLYMWLYILESWSGKFARNERSVALRPRARGRGCGHKYCASHLPHITAPYTSPHPCLCTLYDAHGKTGTAELSHAHHISIADPGRNTPAHSKKSPHSPAAARALSTPARHPKQSLSLSLSRTRILTSHSLAHAPRSRPCPPRRCFDST